eukprot:TRINITY_DN3170_c0_g1_i4.p3 TRINITY_DN3170_c0_g1~~TRINITY_DN3170_c0_g1_i4.p3  ORF type:complete len:110 (-),score=35.88 TRINITY_DN3170_c0_g1_i4:87-416(-)
MLRSLVGSEMCIRDSSYMNPAEKTYLYQQLRDYNCLNQELANLYHSEAEQLEKQEKQREDQDEQEQQKEQPKEPKEEPQREDQGQDRFRRQQKQPKPKTGLFSGLKKQQ